ncbi:MAG TPA: PIN domain-containing protein [Kiritimatiellia bacterium]|nr:PIN domain-containing protein [Kiritimatiellia bacterium]
MKTEVFIDTSAFYALLVKSDDAHARMAARMAAAAGARGRFVTTDYVLDETATLLRARGLGHLVAQFLDYVLASNSCRIAWMDPGQFKAVAAFFDKHRDQPWSFTDCFSFVVMKQHSLREALTKDEHFRAAGFATPLLD